MTDLKAEIEAQYQEVLKDLNTLSDKELREKYTVMPSGWVLLDATHAAEPAPVAVEGMPERVWLHVNYKMPSNIKPDRWWEWSEYIRADLAPTGNAREDAVMRELFDLREALNPPRSGPDAWCQPMDCGKHTPRVWMIRFEDTEVGDMLFDNEADARLKFTRVNKSWNCYLMASLPLTPEAAPTGNTALVEAGKQALAELANVNMHLPLRDWQRISSTILAALQPAAPQPTPEVERIKELENILRQIREATTEHGGAAKALRLINAALARGSVAEKGERNNG